MTNRNIKILILLISLIVIPGSLFGAEIDFKVTMRLLVPVSVSVENNDIDNAEVKVTDNKRENVQRVIVSDDDTGEKVLRVLTN